MTVAHVNFASKMLSPFFKKGPYYYYYYFHVLHLCVKNTPCLLYFTETRHRFQALGKTYHPQHKR